eukprot:s1613_g3.t1
MLEGLSTKRCEALQVIELVLSSLALTCWTAMCVLDLSGYWNEPLESEDSLPSHVLSLSVWCVSCGLFIARQSSICCQKDRSMSNHSQHVPAHSAIWSLVSGALAWLVFHAAHQRRMQVIAGLLAVLALLALLLCTVAYVLREHRKRSKAEARPAKHEDFKRTDGAIRAQAPEAVELSSMTSSVVVEASCFWRDANTKQSWSVEATFPQPFRVFIQPFGLDELQRCICTKTRFTEVLLRIGGRRPAELGARHHKSQPAFGCTDGSTDGSISISTLSSQPCLRFVGLKALDEVYELIGLDGLLGVRPGDNTSEAIAFVERGATGASLFRRLTGQEPGAEAPVRGPSAWGQPGSTRVRVALEQTLTAGPRSDRRLPKSAPADAWDTKEDDTEEVPDSWEDM